MSKFVTLVPKPKLTPVLGYMRRLLISRDWSWSLLSRGSWTVESHKTFDTEAAARKDARRVAKKLGLRITKWA